LPSFTAIFFSVSTIVASPILARPSSAADWMWKLISLSSRSWWRRGTIDVRIDSSVADLMAVPLAFLPKPPPVAAPHYIFLTALLNWRISSLL
jgi:hypothetical protein